MRKKFIISSLTLLLPYVLVGQVIDVVPPLKIEYKSAHNNNVSGESEESYTDALNRIINEVNAEVFSKINSTKKLYSSLGSYPETVKDGWHIVNVIYENPQSPFSQEAKVFVLDNKIKEIYYGGFSKADIALSSQIKNGKSFVKTKSTNGNSSDLKEIYFIDYIIDPSATTTAPEIGYVSFWADFKYEGQIFIKVDNNQAGYLKTYFPKGSSPTSCDEQGVLTLPYKVGTYKVLAKTTNPLKVWEGTITIDKDGCSLFKLSK